MNRYQIAKRLGVPPSGRVHATAIRVHCPGADEALALRALLTGSKYPAPEHRTPEHKALLNGALQGVAAILSAMAASVEEKFSLSPGELSKFFPYVPHYSDPDYSAHYEQPIPNPAAAAKPRPLPISPPPVLTPAPPPPPPTTTAKPPIPKLALPPENLLPPVHTPKPSITRLTPARRAALEAIHAARRGVPVNPPLTEAHRKFILSFGTAVAAARGIGVDPKTVARWLSGDKNPSPAHLQKINRILAGGLDNA